MHLLLAAGAFLLIFVIVPIAQGLSIQHERNTTPPELLSMKKTAQLSKNKEEWAFNCTYLQTCIPAEIRRKSYEDLMRETWGDKYEAEIAMRPFDPKETTCFPRKKYWDDYFSRNYGSNYYIKYPYLKWPETRDENGRPIPINR